ncbi:MAG: hypothetical protein KKD77_20720, partial [Gammaproteobacteria bacterium]|nr:hypothetical protein [Gammaproteobacteria bacterium]
MEQETLVLNAVHVDECPATDTRLSVIVRDSGLEQTKAQVILKKFQDYFAIASDWEAKAKVIKVTDESQKADMALARTGRLFLREKRIAIEKTRKELKEQALREGKAIDGIANVLKALIEPIEEYLDKQERFVEIRAAEKAEADRIEAERKAEEEQIAREKAEAEERERIRQENERLKLEAEERERQAAADRARAEAERKALEEQARKEREAAQERERIAKEKADAEKLALEEKARKEREAAEVKAEAERKAHEQIL